MLSYQYRKIVDGVAKRISDETSDGEVVRRILLEYKLLFPSARCKGLWRYAGREGGRVVRECVLCGRTESVRRCEVPGSIECEDIVRHIKEVRDRYVVLRTAGQLDPQGEVREIVDAVASQITDQTSTHEIMQKLIDGYKKRHPRSRCHSLWCYGRNTTSRMVRHCVLCDRSVSYSARDRRPEYTYYVERSDILDHVHQVYRRARELRGVTAVAT